MGDKDEAIKIGRGVECLDSIEEHVESDGLAGTEGDGEQESICLPFENVDALNDHAHNNFDWISIYAMLTTMLLMMVAVLYALMQNNIKTPYSTVSDIAIELITEAHTNAEEPTRTDQQQAEAEQQWELWKCLNIQGYVNPAEKVEKAKKKVSLRVDNSRDGDFSKDKGLRVPGKSRALSRMRLGRIPCSTTKMPRL